MLSKSVEEKIEDYIKNQLNQLGLKYYTKNEMINDEIEKALKLFPSKNNGTGGNFPDIKLLIDDIPVMIEVKGKFEDLIKKKLTQTGLELDMSWPAIKKYAVNGCCHYCRAILTYSHYDFCIGIGVAENMIYNEEVNPNTNIYSYLVTREKIKMLTEFSNKNNLSYLVNLKRNLNI